MSTLTINENTKLKDLKEYCQKKGIEPIGNKSHKKSWLKGYENWLEEQSTSIVITEPVNETEDIKLPKLTDFNPQKIKLPELITSIRPVNKTVEVLEEKVTVEVLPDSLTSSITIFDIPVKECEVDDVFNLNDRTSIIKELFNKFGKKYGFKVKVERRHDYNSFSEDRLLEHLLWWFLVRGKEVPQSQVSRLWKTDKKDVYTKQLLQDKIVSDYFEMLF